MWLGFPSNAAEKKTNVVFPLLQEYQRHVEYLKKNKDKIQTKCKWIQSYFFFNIIRILFSDFRKIGQDCNFLLKFKRRDMISWITLLKLISYPYLCAFVLPMQCVATNLLSNHHFPLITEHVIAVLGENWHPGLLACQTTQLFHLFSLFVFAIFISWTFD